MDFYYYENEDQEEVGYNDYFYEEDEDDEYGQNYLFGHLRSAMDFVNSIRDEHDILVEQSLLELEREENLRMLSYEKDEGYESCEEEEENEL